jgi:hypothetical protein
MNLLKLAILGENSFLIMVGAKPGSSHTNILVVRDKVYKF